MGQEKMISSTHLLLWNYLKIEIDISRENFSILTFQGKKWHFQIPDYLSKKSEILSESPQIIHICGYAVIYFSPKINLFFSTIDFVYRN